MEFPLAGKQNYGLFLYSIIYLIYFGFSDGIIIILDILLIYLLSGENEPLVPNGSYSFLFYLFSYGDVIPCLFWRRMSRLSLMVHILFILFILLMDM